LTDVNFDFRAIDLEGFYLLACAITDRKQPLADAFRKQYRDGAVRGIREDFGDGAKCVRRGSRCCCWAFYSAGKYAACTCGTKVGNTAITDFFAIGAVACIIVADEGSADKAFTWLRTGVVLYL
jgi:hypothetical protein